MANNSNPESTNPAAAQARYHQQRSTQKFPMSAPKNSDNTPVEGSSKIDLSKEIEVTAELLQICEIDGRDDSYVSSIRACLASLRAGNSSEAAMHFYSVPLGGMGRFDDWVPRSQTNANVFEPTLHLWIELMRRHRPPAPRCPCCGRPRHERPCFEYLGDEK